ncbi:MAG: glycosyltransferase [Ignavibacteriaceae bacterium]|nr:glycosyltransferase [Chlorobium sp.]MCW8824429.1 glycosyltransferase [Ignavibacteriaceae bacterium]MCW8961863.1 glycosyltransferase [Ignavibacteriaceae bacterium]MCW8994204.1 glycosyltransferase [Psychromonas sp.]
MMTKATVIAAFYNRLDYLKLVLAGFERQTEKNFELIIADDGSRKDVVADIKKIKTEYSFPIKHIWQEDKGFRKNKILNKAITESSSDYLIFIDADCVPHGVFVEGHLTFSKKNFSLTGRRVNLSEKITNLLSEKKVRNGFLEKNLFLLIKDGLFGKSFDVEKGLYFKNNFLLNFFNRKSRGLLGCNFSSFKEDLVKVNGFDERYEAPSIGEDSDIQYRLELAGIKIKSINHTAVQYHLYHKLQERTPVNLKLFQEVKKNKIAFTPFGLKK